MFDARDTGALEGAIDTAVRGGADAVLAAGDPVFHRPANRLPDLALRAGLPATYLDRDVVTAGGLMATARTSWRCSGASPGMSIGF